MDVSTVRMPSLLAVGTGAESTGLRSRSSLCSLCVSVRGSMCLCFLCGIGSVANAVRRPRGAVEGCIGRVHAESRTCWHL